MPRKRCVHLDEFLVPVCGVAKDEEVARCVGAKEECGEPLVWQAVSGEGATSKEKRDDRPSQSCLMMSKNHFHAFGRMPHVALYKTGVTICDLPHELLFMCVAGHGKSHDGDPPWFCSS